jgi:Zn-dependent protease with chaperone function
MTTDTVRMSDMQSPASFTGSYFDGKSSARKVTSMVIMRGGVTLFGEGWTRRESANSLTVSEPTENGPVLLRLADGACCEFAASPQLHSLLQQVGVRRHRVALWQGDWRLVALTAAFLVAAIAAFYVWLLPKLAALGSTMVPESAKQRLGAHALQQLDERWFENSKLNEPLRAEILQRFNDLREMGGPQRPAIAARLELRSTRRGDGGKPVIGPNAFALPGGTVVLTDEMVAFLNNDIDAISGVLAHELGHVVHDHSTQSLIKAVALTALGSAIIGDYSSVLAAAPAVLGQLRYSRHAEAQADQFAHAQLCAKEIDPKRTAVFFERVAREDGKGIGGLVPEFLYSHPESAGRAARFRRSCSEAY